jgi:hypothetical protein
MDASRSWRLCVWGVGYMATEGSFLFKETSHEMKLIFLTKIESPQRSILKKGFLFTVLKESMFVKIA